LISQDLQISCRVKCLVKNETLGEDSSASCNSNLSRRGFKCRVVTDHLMNGDFGIWAIIIQIPGDDDSNAHHAEITFFHQPAIGALHRLAAVSTRNCPTCLSFRKYLFKTSFKSSRKGILLRQYIILCQKMKTDGSVCGEKRYCRPRMTFGRIATISIMFSF
jgi:hypothetical protein